MFYFVQYQCFKNQHLATVHGYVVQNKMITIFHIHPSIFQFLQHSSLQIHRNAKPHQSSCRFPHSTHWELHSPRNGRVTRQVTPLFDSSVDGKTLGSLVSLWCATRTRLSEHLPRQDDKGVRPASHPSASHEQPPFAIRKLAARDDTMDRSRSSGLHHLTPRCSSSLPRYSPNLSLCTAFTIRQQET